MKIQLKRSNVLDGSAAKKPSAEQMEYGELAVNYNNGDPAVFLKDSNDAIVRIGGAGSSGSFSGDYNDLANKPTIGNGSINISAGNGLGVSGNNATANQTGDTTRTLTAVAGNSSILVDADGIKVQNANITPDYGNIINTPTIGNGTINVNAGNGLSVAGDNATANQTGDTTRTLTAVAADNSLSVTSSGISVNDGNLTPSWSNIQGKPSNITGAALTSGSYLTGGPYDGSAAKTFNVEATTTATASKVVARDGNNDIYSRTFIGEYMNMTHASATRSSDNIFYSSTDEYVRKTDATGFRTSLNVPTRTGGNASGTWGISITGNAATSSSTSGNASSSTDSRVDHDTGDAWHRPVFITDGQGSATNQRLYSDNGSTIGINPNSNQIRATTFVGALSGNASTASSASSATTATTATNFNVAADNSTNGTHYVIFTGGASGSQRPNSDTAFSYNPSSNTLNAGTFNSTSDITLKTDVTSIDGALSRLCKIEGVGFAWKKTGARTYGVIAQDVEKEFPELVQTEEFKSVNYNGLVGVLIEAVKELQAEVSQLKSQL